MSSKEWIKTALGVGGNLGNRLVNLKAAAHAITALPDCRRHRFSKLFETEAVDCAEPMAFLNGAVTFETKLGPQRLLEKLQAIENRFGRTRPYRNAPRPIDLDILIYGDHIINTINLQIPHPRMKQRLFVLRPLAEIWPDLIPPGSDHDVTTLADLLPDSGVKLLESSWA